MPTTIAASSVTRLRSDTDLVSVIGARMPGVGVSEVLLTAPCRA
jgi:hypothetical protein